MMPQTWTKWQKYQFRKAPVTDTSDIPQRVRVKARTCSHHFGSVSDIDATMLHFNLDEERTCIYCSIPQVILRRLNNDG